VLLVEDNPINALLAPRASDPRGVRGGAQPTSGQEALNAVQVGVFDLNVMDMRMPGPFGARRTARLLRCWPGETAPIVALTA
jgi:CheY-like chemotaxis protein